MTGTILNDPIDTDLLVRSYGHMHHAAVDTRAEREIAVREDRQMPSLKEIAKHHGIRSDICYRCKRPARCDRAHVITRTQFPVDTPAEVMDAPSNLVPVCPPCHRAEPFPFAPGEEEIAWAWYSGDAEAYARCYLDHLCQSGLPRLFAWDWAQQVGLDTWPGFEVTAS